MEYVCYHFRIKPGLLDCILVQCQQTCMFIHGLNRLFIILLGKIYCLLKSVKLVKFTASVYVNLRKYIHHVKEAELMKSIAHSFSNLKICTYYVSGTVLDTKDA